MLFWLYPVNPMHYYPIPEASKYEVGSDSYIYRILKCGRRKKLRRHLYRRTGGKGDWQTTIVFDDGKRRTVRPDYLAVELGPSVAETRSRDHGKDYIELPSLWCLYLVNHNGDVLEQRRDYAGIYYKKKSYYEDTTTNAPKTMERIGLRTSDLGYRTFTRKRLKELVEERTQNIMQNHG